MTLVLIIIASWLLALSLIVALCLSARRGDLQQLDPSTGFLVSDLRPAKRANSSVNAQTKTPVIARRSSGKPSNLSDPTRPAAQLKPYSAFLASTLGGCKNRPANVRITRSTAASTASLLEGQLQANDRGVLFTGPNNQYGSWCYRLRVTAGPCYHKRTGET